MQEKGFPFPHTAPLHRTEAYLIKTSLEYTCSILSGILLVLQVLYPNPNTNPTPIATSAAVSVTLGVGSFPRSAARTSVCARDRWRRCREGDNIHETCCNSCPLAAPLMMTPNRMNWLNRENRPPLQMSSSRSGSPVAGSKRDPCN